jgi:3-hydroxyacyl-CoA dehydrogenase
MGSPAQQAAWRRTGGRPVRGRVASKAAIATARKKHRQKALKRLRAGKLTPAEYQKLIKRIG